ncbi:MAG: tetratricopeptide repeat protein [Pseudomonadota bacterium]
MDQYQTDQEQVEKLKRWWNENGKSLLFGLIIGGGALGGYRYWEHIRVEQAQAASYNYEQFLSLAQGGNVDDARQAGQVIVENYEQSVYADLTGLMLAKLAVDASDYEQAKADLETIISRSNDPLLADLARARMARVLLHQGDASAAKDLLAAIKLSDGNQRFPELMGDAELALGAKEEALRFYQLAIDVSDSADANREILQIKIDNLGL